jgi:hypothetical protein
MFPGTGCVLDGSHMSSMDFTLAVIDLAVDAGFEIDREQYGADVEAYKNDGLDEDMLYEVLDALDWTYEDAIDYLNSGLPDNLRYTVEDQSLFLEELDD